MHASAMEQTCTNVVHKKLGYCAAGMIMHNDLPQKTVLQRHLVDNTTTSIAPLCSALAQLGYLLNGHTFCNRLWNRRWVNLDWSRFVGKRQRIIMHDDRFLYTYNNTGTGVRPPQSSSLTGATVMWQELEKPTKLVTHPLHKWRLSYARVQ